MSKLFWTGSDVLFATRLIGGRKFPTRKIKYFYFLAHTVFAKIADLVVDGHVVVSEHMIGLLKPLKLKKPFQILIDPPLYPQKFKKKSHEGFNILYYRTIKKNQPFLDWVYGKDIMDSVIDRIDELILVDKISIIEVNGKTDMGKIYPVIDCMIRPNRSDGCPRMVMELVKRKPK